MESMRSSFRSRCTSYRPSRSSFSGLSASPNACSRTNHRFANAVCGSPTRAAPRPPGSGATLRRRRWRAPRPRPGRRDRGRELRTAILAHRQAAPPARLSYGSLCREPGRPSARRRQVRPVRSVLCGSGPATAGGHPTCDPAMVWPCRELRCPAARTGRLRHRRGRRSSCCGDRRASPQTPRRRCRGVAAASPAYP